MTDGGPIKPNEIADTYQALSEYHELVSRLASVHEKITGETESTLHIFSELIGEKRGEFGKATATRNPFTMQEYRDRFSDELPVIKTEGLTPAERAPLEWLGVIDDDETFRLPYNPRTGERVNIWPINAGLNMDHFNLQAFTVPSSPVTLFHISDTHLGYRNRVKKGGGGKTKWVNRSDSLAAFNTVLHRAVQEDVDAVIHTGDLFDHDVDQDTLEEALSSIITLTENGIPFYFILGDHDRLATGGSVPDATDAIRALEILSDSESVIHATTTGKQVDASPVLVFGVDTAGVGFKEIQRGFTLSGWSPYELEFDAPMNKGTNILCLHEQVQELKFSEIIDAASLKDHPLDLILLGNEHRPPFDGEWQTTIDGVTVACAGPTIPISSYFDDNSPGYNRVRIGSNGNLGVDRRTLS